MPCHTPSPSARRSRRSAHSTAATRARCGYLEPRFPVLNSELGRSFVAATDTFVRVFMATMATEARRYGVYVIASNSQAPFRDDTRPGGGRRAAGPGHAESRLRLRADRRAVPMTRPSCGDRSDVHRDAPAPIANLIADNRKVPLTSFEQALGLRAGAVARVRRASQSSARARFPAPLRTSASRPASPPSCTAPRSRGHECDDVSVTYMRCLDRLGCERPDSGRRQRRPVDGPGRQRSPRAVATALVDGIGLARGQRPVRPLRILRSTR